MLRLDPSNSFLYLDIDGRRVYIEDPFDEEHRTLIWPRKQAGSVWVPFGAAPAADHWRVFFFNSWNRTQIVQWFVNHEGRYLDQQAIGTADLIPFIEHLHLPAERLFLGLMLQFPEAGRAASLRTLRLGIGDRQMARRFLYGYYQALGRPALAKRHARRLGDHDGLHQPAASPSVAVAGPVRVLYLIQSARRLPAELEQGFAAAGADFHCLTFREDIDDPRYSFAPGSTWTSGRNLLLQRSRPDLDRYDYVVLMDDDVRFEDLGFGEALGRFHDFLGTMRPEICVAATPWHTGFGHHYDEHASHVPVDGFDALFNAFRRDVILDGVLLPYVESFDHSSWWSSQLVMMKLASRYYITTQFNGICASSLNSSDYPRGDIGELAVRCLLRLCCGHISAVSQLGPHAVEHHDGFNPLQSSLQKRILRYFSFNPDLRDSLYRQPIEAF